MLNEKKNNNLVNWLISNAKMTAIIVGVLIAILMLTNAYLRLEVDKKQKQEELLNILTIEKQNIERNLQSKYNTAVLMAINIEKERSSSDYDTISKQLLVSTPIVDVIQIIPNGIISYTYPKEGNEKVIGLNIFKDFKNTEIARNSIIEKRVTYEGPIDLHQGGKGIICRFPIYTNDNLWGFTGTITRLETFVKQTGLEKLKKGKHHFLVSKINPSTHQEEFFLGNKQELLQKHHHEVTIEALNWKLYIVDNNPNNFIATILLKLAYALIIGILAGYFVFNILRKPQQLQELITEKNQQLHNRNQIYRSIVENAFIGIVQIDRDGNVIECNDKTLEILEISNIELQKSNIIAILNPGNQNLIHDYIADYKNTPEHEFKTDQRYITARNEIKWLQITINPLEKENRFNNKYILFLEDITERNTREQEILIAKNNFESMINTVNGVTWELVAGSAGVTFISKQCETILGYTPEEWCSDTFFWEKHIHPDDYFETVERARILKESMKPHVLEYRFIHKNGNTIWIWDQINVLHENNLVKFRGIMFDMTVTKEFEADLNKSLELVTEQNKRLLDFSYIVSHNLRSHTSNIQSLSFLIETAESTEEIKEYTALIKKVSEALDDTIANLNQVISIQADVTRELEIIYVNDILSRTLQILQNKIEATRAEIIVDIPTHLTLMYNPVYFESILLNFISNAIRYAHPERDPIIKIKHESTPEFHILHIQDNGIGIDLKRHEKQLFGMYKTFTNHPESKGLGLFITKNQIDTMGGKIEVESEINVGTTFKIFFKK